MIIKLTDDEIRVALAEFLAKKLDYSVEVVEQSCWFECKAGVIEDGKIEDIHDVKFCFDTQNVIEVNHEQS